MTKVLRGVLVAGLGLGVVCVGLVAVYGRDAVPVYRGDAYSIAIYQGEEPHRIAPLAEGQLAVTIDDVDDRSVRLVADPFMIQREGHWYMFFEAVDRKSRKGVIGLATSADLKAWDYDRVVLEEPFHLSYPFVFEEGGEVYMLPESSEAGAVKLYRAASFPHVWEPVADLLKGEYFDSTLLRRDGRWWLFVGANLAANDTLRLFSSASLTGPYVEHPGSPLVEGDANIARPGGRVIEADGELIRFGQDDEPYYGNALRAFRITQLSESEYVEVQVAGGPVIGASGQGWNELGMHHADLHFVDGKWVGCVDGYRKAWFLGWK